MADDDDTTLVEPHVDLRRSYLDYRRELTEASEPAVPFPLSYPSDDFPALIERLQADARGEGVPEGFVAHSTFWLLDGQREVVGVSNLRHALTPRLRIEGGHIGYGVRPSRRRRGFGRVLLRETLTRARARGLTEVLITCAADNAGSIGVILANGGVFSEEAFVAARGERLRRYWIQLGPGGAN